MMWFTLEQLRIILVSYIGLIVQKTYSQVTKVSLVGPTAGQGRVEILKDGIWGTFCDSHFTSNDAKIICKMAYPTYDVHVPCVESVFGYGTGEIHFGDLECNGTEMSLNNCRYKTHNNCYHSEDAGVICNATSVKLRLVDGYSDGMGGRLEVEINGEWGTVCNDQFNTRGAKVACRQMGKPFSHAYSATFPGGTGKVFLDGISCAGTESMLLECQMSVIGMNDCPHSSDVGMVCSDKEPGVEAHLVGGSKASEGRVEVRYTNGVWGTICDNLWDEHDARVVCNMLGYTTGKAEAVGHAYFGQGTGFIYMNDVQCNGTEHNVADCTFDTQGTKDCNHLQDAGVICNADTYITQVRLIGGNGSSEGRAEVLYNNTWGTICDDSFDDREARVICNMLGFTNSMAVAVGGAYFGRGTGPIHMDDLACSGQESDIALCRFSGFDQHNCDHTEDAGVICNSGETAEKLMIRLVNGKTTNEGRLEVFHNNQWGTVCDDLFGRESARVVCKMLGLPTTEAEAVKNAFFGEGIGQIWLDNVHCIGVEKSIQECRHNIFGVTNCQHSEDVGIRCGGLVESPVRLVGGVGPDHGRLEVYHQDEWGTVCADGFGVSEAKVICNLVGYPSANPLASISRKFGLGKGSVWLSGVRCNGSEPAIDLCTHDEWGRNSCGHDKDVSVDCQNHRLRCYHCDGLVDPHTCNDMEQCSPGEECEEAAYLINGETRVSMRCQSQEVCRAITSTSNVGKRWVRQTSVRVSQAKCCRTALCNRGILNITRPGISSGAGTCEDKTGTDCAALDATNICDNSQAASSLCPKHCGLCT